MVEQVRPLTEGTPSREHIEGLNYWLLPHGKKAKIVATRLSYGANCVLCDLAYRPFCTSSVGALYAKPSCVSLHCLYRDY